MCFVLLIFLLFSNSVQTNVVNSNEFGPCTTPDNHRGKCMFINNCAELDKLLQKRVLTEAEKRFLSQSECTNVDEEEVVLCCRTINTEVPVVPSLPVAEHPIVPIPPVVPTPPVVPLLPTQPECGVEAELRDKIMYGNVTKIWEYPWMALLLYSGPGEPPLNGCGGALINSRYVLTAAHCLSPIRKQRTRLQLTTVRLGEWDTSTTTDTDEYGEVSDPVVDIRIEEKIVHELYNRSIKGAYNDIALLRLARDVEYTRYIRPICIHRTDDLLNKDMSTVEMFAAGWGYTEENTVSNKKLGVSLLGKSIGSCQMKYRPSKIYLIDTQLCAGGEDSDTATDTCSGDSGGPLVLLHKNSIPIHFHVVGVISFGPVPCGQRNFPGVYTKVVKYVNWIESKLRP